MYQIGEKIVIKNNAFKGSDEPSDFEWRGKVGKVVLDIGDNCYEVYVEGMGNCLLIASEMKRANKRLHTDAGESTVKMGSLTPEEDAAIKADNKPAQRG